MRCKFIDTYDDQQCCQQVLNDEKETGLCYYHRKCQQKIIDRIPYKYTPRKKKE